MPAGGFRRIVAALRDYAAHPDPRAALANAVALVVASNQPFYPLYIYWTVSPTIWPSYVSFLSTPLFLAVPALMRRSTLLGRATLLFAGIGNTALCRAALGGVSGVDVFLFPCLVLALLLFRRSERAVGLGFAAIAGAVYLGPAALPGVDGHLYAAGEYEALQRLNFISAATLTALIGLLFANILENGTRRPSETETPPET
ncbi:hypothetical protein [Bosea sp. 124]|uniref:hypothetical protein n=1 Tax=Bosea sp. 124 TaxID=2135642 RepID=UPI000D34D9D5|nr:hypothetical protein [Bosea sp. 124]PTM40027.1 hypothetical protein C8D03_1538 [Bosea sp. 124]